MKHIEDEDLARLIDGSVSKKERKRLRQHISECSKCFDLYTESLKSIEIEERKESPSPVSGPNTAHIIWKTIRDFFTVKRYRLALAAFLVILLVSIPIVLKEFSYRKIENNKITSVEDRITTRNILAAVPDTTPENIAVRTGIYLRDLSILIHNSQKEDMKDKIINLLRDDLIALGGEKENLFREPGNIDKENFDAIVNRIRKLMNNHSLMELYRFGDFLESTILSTFENKIPNQEDIEKYLQIARNRELLKAVIDGLNKLQSITGLEETRECCKEIEEIFLQ